MRSFVRLADVSEGRDNNVHLIRMIAALAVVVSHAWPLTMGPRAVEPLRLATGFNLGTLGVFAFFAISGFLVTRSYERQPTAWRWLLARALRIFPGLLVVLVLTVLVVGPLVTTLSVGEYFGAPATLSYIPINLSLAVRQVDLPGVFRALPYPDVTNGPLWTLYYEVLCYGAVLVMGLAGAFRSWSVLTGVAAAYMLANAAAVATPAGVLPEQVETFLFFAVPFACGVVFYLARAWLPLTPWVLPVLAGAAFAARSTPLDLPLFVLTLSYGVFLLAFLPGGWPRRYNRLGDYSFGVYIYAWPVQQTVVQLLGPMGPLRNVLIVVPVVLALAWLSWTLVEGPSLGLIRR